MSPTPTVMVDIQWGRATADIQVMVVSFFVLFLVPTFIITLTLLYLFILPRMADGNSAVTRARTRFIASFGTGLLVFIAVLIRSTIDYHRESFDPATTITNAIVFVPFFALIAFVLTFALDSLMQRVSQRDTAMRKILAAIIVYAILTVLFSPRLMTPRTYTRYGWSADESPFVSEQCSCMGISAGSSGQYCFGIPGSCSFTPEQEAECRASGECAR